MGINRKCAPFDSHASQQLCSHYSSLSLVNLPCRKDGSIMYAAPSASLNHAANGSLNHADNGSLNRPSDNGSLNYAAANSSLIHDAYGSLNRPSANVSLNLAEKRNKMFIVKSGNSVSLDGDDVKFETIKDIRKRINSSSHSNFKKDLQCHSFYDRDHVSGVHSPSGSFHLSTSQFSNREFHQNSVNVPPYEPMPHILNKGFHKNESNIHQNGSNVPSCKPVLQRYQAQAKMPQALQVSRSQGSPKVQDRAKVLRRSQTRLVSETSSLNDLDRDNNRAYRYSSVPAALKNSPKYCSHEFQLHKSASYINSLTDSPHSNVSNYVSSLKNANISASPYATSYSQSAHDIETCDKANTTIGSIETLNRRPKPRSHSLAPPSSGSLHPLLGARPNVRSQTYDLPFNQARRVTYPRTSEITEHDKRSFSPTRKKGWAKMIFGKQSSNAEDKKLDKSSTGEGISSVKEPHRGKSLFSGSNRANKLGSNSFFTKRDFSPKVKKKLRRNRKTDHQQRVVLTPYKSKSDLVLRQDNENNNNIMKQDILSSIRKTSSSLIPPDISSIRMDNYLRNVKHYAIDFQRFDASPPRIR